MPIPIPTPEPELKLKLKLEPELELAPPPLEGEPTALVGSRGIVAMMLAMGSMAKMLDELLQQAILPGPLPCVSQQLDEGVSCDVLSVLMRVDNVLLITGQDTAARPNSGTRLTHD